MTAGGAATPHAELGQEASEGSFTKTPRDLDPDLTTRAYRSSQEHLWDEMRRIEQWVRAQTVCWRLTVAENKPEELWGMVHVTDQEVMAYLDSSLWSPQQLPDTGSPSSLRPYWRTAEAMAALIERRKAATPRALPLRLLRLQTLFALSNLEIDIILVCLLPELDTRIRRLYGYLQDDVMRSRPSVELVLQILAPRLDDLAEGRWAFNLHSPLFMHNILAVDEQAQRDLPFLMRALHLDDRIVAYLLDDDRPDQRLREALSISPSQVRLNELIVEAECAHQLQTVVERRLLASERSGGLTVLLAGPYGSGRLAAAQAICNEITTPLLIVDAEAATRCPLEWERLLQLCYREAMLEGAAIYWRNCEALLEPEMVAFRWEKLVAAAEGFAGLTFLERESAWEPTGRFQQAEFARITLGVPAYSLRRRLWERTLPQPHHFAGPAPDRLALIDALANAFLFTQGQMADSVASAWSVAIQRAPQQPQLTSEDLYLGCRRQSGKRLITMARRVPALTELDFDDLILPPINQRQIDELRARIRYRSLVFGALGFERRLSLGKGLIALFTGGSGTGKTMAAELLASEQGVDLYKVDLASIVSKYVGETEKNLSQIFADAESANAILFFDEADALFGKRGEVKESRDRWANLEVNYLLQRIEEFAGVVILATNLQQNIDDAFLRRIHAIVDFPFPDAVARYHICRGLFPAGIKAPSDMELQELTARFNLAGGSLKNAVIDATFRALNGSGGEPVVELRHLVFAIAREYQKIGKPIMKGEFGEEFYAWVSQEFF